MSMGMFEQGLAAMEAKCNEGALIRRENINDSLKRQLANHAAQSKKIERLLSLLERNPDFEELLNLTREVGGY